MNEADWVDRVLAFWFDELGPKDWWSGKPEVDARIRERFATLRDVLIRDRPAAADLDADGHLAAVIVYDQFSRNLFRGSAEAFAADALALAMTMDAIERGLDLQIAPARRLFLYLPFEHSEDAGMQALSLTRFASLNDPRALHSARAHHATITRFGRFPYRNAALGRESTAEELAFLATHPTPQ